MRPSPTAVLLGLLYLVGWLAPCVTAAWIGFAVGLAVAQQYPGFPRVSTLLLSARTALEELLARHAPRFL